MKYLTCALTGLVFVSAVSFAQNSRIIGNIPCSNTDALYDVQVGAFRVIANAAKAAEKVSAAGFVPVYEKYQNLVRVIVAGLASSEVQSCIERLRGAGFREVIVRKAAARTNVERTFDLLPDKDAAAGIPPAEIPAVEAAPEGTPAEEMLPAELPPVSVSISVPVIEKAKTPPEWDEEKPELPPHLFQELDLFKNLGF